jgi:hypothetical protein
MSLPIDSQTPLLLVSELKARINSATASDVSNRLLGIITQASQAFQAACGRRFDEYIEQRFYTPTHISTGGDLFGLRELLLDADLKSYTSIINGDASTINPGIVTLLPLNAAYKTTIRLNPYGIQFWYHAGVTDPIGSISVTGTWGYGGSWIGIGTGATLSLAMTDTTGTALTSSVALENGMVIKVDTEYMYVSAAGTPNTVIRGYNGSIAATHLVNAPITRWQAMASVQKCITRLIQVALEQDKAPLFGQTIIGDVIFPVVVDSYPKDVVADVKMNKLKRMPRLQAV